MFERKEEASAFVGKILHHFGVKASLDWKNKDGQEILDIHGEEEIDMLLANGGKVLYSIEYLVNLIFGDREESRILLDCNDFRALRSYELELLAKKAAEKVKISQRPFPLQPMPASERRIVHLTLVEDPQVKTESQGFGDNRRVIIMPTK
ncbi:MAG TPA: R3H domain-containing nucleic acid-binding protein [Acidobacteriota bacterium]|jgi:spoIIIJ-associated protein